MRLTVLATATAVFATPLFAEADGETVYDVIGMPQIIEVMSKEGLGYTDGLARDFFAGGRPAAWDEAIDKIYGPEALGAAMRSEFLRAVGDETFPEVVDFYSSDVGQKIISLEVSARTAMLEDDLTEALEADVRANPERNDIVFNQVEAFIEGNDLINENTIGGMNANIEFYRGLVSIRDGAFAFTEDQILEEVWSQEAEIRENTTTWLYAYYLFAHAPLSEAERDQIIEISQSAEGRALNAALFEAFDEVFKDISFALGATIAELSLSQDL